MGLNLGGGGGDSHHTQSTEHFSCPFSPTHCSSASELIGSPRGTGFGASSACVVLLIIGALIASLGAWRIARHNRRQRLAAEAAEAAA